VCARIVCPRLPLLPVCVYSKQTYHTAHTVRGILCVFSGNPVPLDSRVFQAGKWAFHAFCGSVCAPSCILVIFFIYAGLRKQWSGRGSAATKGTPLWEQCLATGTSLTYTVATSHLRTFRCTRKYTNGRVHTYSDSPRYHRPNTRAPPPPCNKTKYHITAPQIWLESHQRTERYQIWAEVSTWNLWKV